MEWKLTRGKWRPKLLDYAKAHSEEAVREATCLAFESMDEAAESTKGLKEAMSALTELKVMMIVVFFIYAVHLQVQRFCIRFNMVHRFSHGDRAHACLT